MMGGKDKVQLMKGQGWGSTLLVYYSGHQARGICIQKSLLCFQGLEISKKVLRGKMWRSSWRGTVEGLNVLFLYLIMVNAESARVWYWLIHAVLVISCNYIIMSCMLFRTPSLTYFERNFSLCVQEREILMKYALGGGWRVSSGLLVCYSGHQIQNIPTKPSFLPKMFLPMSSSPVLFIYTNTNCPNNFLLVGTVPPNNLDLKKLPGSGTFS